MLDKFIDENDQFSGYSSQYMQNRLEEYSTRQEIDLTKATSVIAGMFANGVKEKIRTGAPINKLQIDFFAVKDIAAGISEDQVVQESIAYLGIVTISLINKLSTELRYNLWKYGEEAMALKSIMKSLSIFISADKSKGVLLDRNSSDQIISYLTKVLPILSISGDAGLKIRNITRNLVEEFMYPARDTLIAPSTFPETIRDVFEGKQAGFHARRLEQMGKAEIERMLGTRTQYFVDERRWQIPYPEPQLISRLREVVKGELNLPTHFDLDENDFASLYFAFYHDLADQLNATRARAIRLINHETFDNALHYNGTLKGHLSHVLGSMHNSPFDATGEGTHIDRDVRAQKEMVEIVSSFEKVPDYNLEFKSATEQTTDALYAYLTDHSNNIPRNSILDQFINKLITQQSILLIERLTPAEVTDSSKLVHQTILMCEMALYAFKTNQTLWMMQCDDTYKRILTGLFGENSFYQLSATCQVKGHKSIEGKFVADRCNTLLLDITAALKYLESNNPELAAYMHKRMVEMNLDTPEAEVSNRFEPVPASSPIVPEAPQGYTVET